MADENYPRRHFSRAALAAAMVFALTAPAFAQDPPKTEEKKTEEKKTEEKKTEVADITGKWDLTVETQGGPRTVAATFKLDDDKVSGTIAGPQGDMAVSGTITASELTFSGVFNTQNGELKIVFTGKPDAEKMEGSVELGTLGAGKWSAQRPKQ